MIAIIAVLMALDLFGIDIGPAVAGLGVVGIAVGFGAQTLVRDWLAGIFIVLENQYSAGDVVRIAGVEGVVEDFSLRRTTLRDARRHGAHRPERPDHRHLEHDARAGVR